MSPYDQIISDTYAAAARDRRIRARLSIEAPDAPALTLLRNSALRDVLRRCLETDALDAAERAAVLAVLAL